LHGEDILFMQIVRDATVVPLFYGRNERVGKREFLGDVDRGIHEPSEVPVNYGARLLQWLLSSRIW
jgi:hypothetical protein